MAAVTAPYNAFLGGTGDNGLGAALLYSGQDGRGWRQGSDDRFNDLALKFAYAIDAQQELRALSYYDVRSLTPGGLTRAQYEATRSRTPAPPISGRATAPASTWATPTRCRPTANSRCWPITTKAAAPAR